jgi:hypothetical protein
MTRGAPMYHLVMAWRDDRSNTTALTLLCRLAAQFKDQDARDGRRSWDAGAVRARYAHLQNATVLDNNVLGLRRTGGRK